MLAVVERSRESRGTLHRFPKWTLKIFVLEPSSVTSVDLLAGLLEPAPKPSTYPRIFPVGRLSLSRDELLEPLGDEARASTRATPIPSSAAGIPAVQPIFTLYSSATGTTRSRSR